MKASKVDVMHLKKMDELFVRCDKTRSGQIKKSRFLMKLAKY